MNDKSSPEPPEVERGKDALPANLDKLKTQLEQLAADRKADLANDPKTVAPRFGGR
jgi:hypothetical protein